MSEKQTYFYVTTPIYYVNDDPHIGHAYTTVLADVLARYHRLLGVPTFFLTGTDEHGEKVFRAATKHGISPQQQADATVVHFLELWKKLEITNDDFLRTTEERHERVVSEILQDLYERGEIYKDKYEGWYSVSEERFFTEKELVDGKDPISGRPVEWIEEENYFFRMSQYQDWLVGYINKHPEFIQPDFRRNETLGFLRQPLGDLCVSRPKSRLAWGIELPFDRDYVCYVWFDALVNYISAVGYRRDDAMFQKWWPVSYHLIGKDILTTHTVYWPTMLKAMGVPLPRTVFAHGWWLAADSKMSKTEGNVVNPMELCEKYGVDAFRYYLMAEMTLGHDSSFSEDSFIERYNNDLADNLGNMLSRVLKMILPHFGGRLPAAGKLQAVDTELEQTVLATVASMEAAIRGMQINRGLESILNAVKACNRYFEQTRPWALAKSGDKERLGTVLNTAAEALRIISGLLYPVIPARMYAMREALGIAPADLEPKVAKLQEWGQLPAGAEVSDVKSLFPRINVKEFKEKEHRKPVKEENVVDLINISQFAQVQLKTAKVVTAERVAGADRLLKMQIELGDEQRQIVAGIAQHYAPEDLAGKNIIVVTNLEPATIRGVESNGMLLAAKQGDKLTLLTTDHPDFASGAPAN